MGGALFHLIRHFKVILNPFCLMQTGMEPPEESSCPAINLGSKKKTTLQLK